ncbi:MAG TPA: GIY-YIG nuclease family protein [Bacteroidia bacterium]
MCVCYILYSEERGRFYIGHTCDEMSERLRKHNSNHKGFTGRVEDWQLVYQEQFSSKEEALHRELEIKKWKSRKRILALIENYKLDQEL